MKYIRTPTGEMFKYEDCEICEQDECLDTEELSEILFQQTGILVAIEKGGENEVE